MAALQSELEAKKAEVAELNEQLAGLGKSHEASVASKFEGDQQCDEMQKRLAEIESKLVQAQNAKDAAEAESAKLYDECSALQETIRTTCIDPRVPSESPDVPVLREQIERLHATLQVEKNTIAHLRAAERARQQDAREQDEAHRSQVGALEA